MKKILFGCGMMGQRAVSEYGKENIEFFVDNYKKGEFNGIPILGFQEFIKKVRGGGINSNIDIIICVMDYGEIAAQLDREGINYDIYPYIVATVPALSKKIAHGKWISYLVQHFDFPDKKILEIGSRNVIANVRSSFKNAQYIGLDVYPGENVDIIGDIHCLSTYFSSDERYDLIFSSAVFEHLAMPWRAAVEIGKCLKLGGYVFIETHYSYSSHERPWHFFQFSEQALKVLFSEEMGFRTVEAGVSNPIYGVFSDRACDYLRGRKVTDLYCHSEFLGQKVQEVENFDWNNVSLDKLYGRTCYPRPIDNS